MKQIQNVEYNYKGNKIKVTEQVYTRGGSKSPELTIVVWNGVRYTPYAQRRVGMVPTLNGMFSRVYGPLVKSLTPTFSPFWALVPKADEKGTPVLIKKGEHY